MQNRLKWFSMVISVELLFTCLTVLAPFHFDSNNYLKKSLIHADQGIPAGYESYFSRPDILQTPAQKPSHLSEEWRALKAAHFSFVAELLALYPKDTKIYFLARDSEYLYDVAKLVTEGTDDFNRIHLLNVSRANMRHPDIKAYLSESGITEKYLLDGKKVLFVDTGFAGTIPRVITELFPPSAAQHLKTHLVVSDNLKHPSSRAFLVHLNPSVNDQRASDMHGTIVTYERMPRYTDRSIGYVKSDGHLHPVSPIQGSTDGSVSKSQSLQFMQDIRAEWETPAVKLRFKQDKLQTENIISLLLSNDEAAIEQLKADLRKTENTPEGRFMEALIRDIFESINNAGLDIRITIDQLGLKDHQNNGEKKLGKGKSVKKNPPKIPKKESLMTKFPEWKPILENPEDMIPKLFKNEAWQMIGSLIDANVDVEINRLLINSLFDQAATGIKKSLQILFIEKADAASLFYLNQKIFSQEYAKDMKDLLKLIIEKAKPDQFHSVIRFVFSKAYTSNMLDLLKLVIEEADATAIRDLQTFVFHEPHAKSLGHKMLESSLKIENRSLRMAFIKENLLKIKSSLPSIQATVVQPKAISASLMPGDKIQIRDRIMTVLAKAGEGRRGIVFQVQTNNGAKYALKVAKDFGAETLNSLAKESSKADLWHALKIPYAKVLVHEKTYVLKPWIEGVRGDEVVEGLASVDQKYRAAADSLLALVSKIRAQGAYVGDFRPANLIWVANKAWVIIDSGGIEQGMSFETAHEKWLNADHRGIKFERRWKMKVPLPAWQCNALFSQ